MSDGLRSLRRVEGDHSALVAELEPSFASVWHPRLVLLIWSDGVRVRTLQLPPGEQGCLTGPWRRVGDRLYGGLYEIQGNWESPSAIVLRRAKGKWVLASQTHFGHEAGLPMRFVNSRGADLRVHYRSYDVLSFEPPHAGPLADEVSTWRVRNGRYQIGPWRRVHNAFEAFDRCCLAALTGKVDILRSLCPPVSIRRELLGTIRALRIGDPPHYYLNASSASDQGEFGTSFALRNGNLGQESRFAFDLTRNHGRWLITGMRRNPSREAGPD